MGLDFYKNSYIPAVKEAGGRAVDQHSYFIQDYYSYLRNYEIIYQIRANGTHRVFPWGSPLQPVLTTPPITATPLVLHFPQPSNQSTLTQEHSKS